MDTDNVKEFMLNTVIQWTAFSIIIDYLSWVLIPHKFRLTHKEFYIDYQPYITLIYVAIFVSHMYVYTLFCDVEPFSSVVIKWG